MYKALTALSIAGLIIVLSMNEAMAGHGGGGKGGGGSFGGGGLQGERGDLDRSSSGHIPSGNGPGAGSNFSRSNFGAENRTILPQNMGVNRSNLAPGGRSGFNLPPNIGQGLNPGQRGTIGNRATFGNLNQFNANRAINFNRPNYGNWYHGDWHGNWNHPWRGWPATWWTTGFISGWGWGAAATPWSWGYWPYYNPYYMAPVMIDGGTIDYSKPIVTALPPNYAADDQVSETAAQTAATDQAMRMLNAARESFMQGEYDAALSQVNEAIATLPNDTVLHEFRGLALFALKRYQESAAAVYAVLSVGPGWDWTTLSSLYPNVEVYTDQLRALENYQKQNPKSADAHFLLAYQYLTCGHTEAAAAQFKQVVSLNPKDQLSSQLLASLSTSTGTEAAKPTEPAAPPKPIDAAALAGNWKSTRADGATIALSLTPDGKYTWKFTQNDKPQEFSGAYTVADNLLILKQGNNPVMVGQVTLMPGNSFNFKLAGDNPNDPGLTFSR